jgi:hypothetical protein
MYENMTDDQFFAEIARIYGDDWTFSELEPGTELYREYLQRTETGV